MSEDTQSPFEATRALKHQERNLGGASFVGQDVSSPVSAKNNVEERKNNVEESKQTKQSREEMREEGQSGEGKSNEAQSDIDIDMPEIESDDPSRDDESDEINEEQHEIAFGCLLGLVGRYNMIFETEPAQRVGVPSKILSALFATRGLQPATLRKMSVFLNKKSYITELPSILQNMGHSRPYASLAIGENWSPEYADVLARLCANRAR